MTHVSPTLHNDAIHDCQANYYGTLVATSSSDKTVCIYTLNPDGSFGPLIDTLVGHHAAVWMSSWAHPNFGTTIATASYDGKILIWTQSNTTRRFDLIYTNSSHRGSVNAITWAPESAGLRLASASSDGTVRELRCENGVWSESIVIGQHAMGALCVSWSTFNDNDGESPILTNLICTGGCDSIIKLWTNSSVDGQFWLPAAQIVCKDWIRDVAFDPVDSLLLAIASQDKCVRFIRLTREEMMTMRMKKSQGTDCALVCDLSAHVFVTSLADVPWRLSWNPTGGVVAVTSADELVTLFREVLHVPNNSSNEESTSSQSSEWCVVNTFPISPNGNETVAAA